MTGGLFCACTHNAFGRTTGRYIGSNLLRLDGFLQPRTNVVQRDFPGSHDMLAPEPLSCPDLRTKAGNPMRAIALSDPVVGSNVHEVRLISAERPHLVAEVIVGLDTLTHAKVVWRGSSRAVFTVPFLVSGT